MNQVKLLSIWRKSTEKKLKTKKKRQKVDKLASPKTSEEQKDELDAILESMRSHEQSPELKGIKGATSFLLWLDQNLTNTDKSKSFDDSPLPSQAEINAIIDYLLDEHIQKQMDTAAER